MVKRRFLGAFLGSALALVLGGLLITWFANHDEGDASLLAEVSYLRDTEGLNYIDLPEQAFQPIGPNFSGGYDPATHWFRIRLTVPDAPTPVVIGVFPPFLDHLTLFASDDGRAWTRQQTGDAVQGENRSWKSASLGFIVKPTTAENVYFLRLRTDSTAQVFLTARPLGNELVHESRRMAAHGLLFALMGLAIIVSIMQTLFRPTAANVLLSASSLSYLVYSVLLLGYAGVALPGWDLSRISAAADVMYFVAAGTSIAFHRTFLDRMRPLRASLWFADILAAGCFAALAVYAAGFHVEAFEANTLLVLASILAVFVMAQTASESGDPPLPFIRAIYTVFTFFSVGWMTVNLGLTQATQLHRYSVEVHGLLNVLLALSLVLSRWWSAERKHAVRKRHLQDAALRQAASTRAAELQDKLLNMLVHEVRNQLATIRMSVETVLDGTDRAGAASVVDRLERTISDCVRLAWLERGEWLPKPGQSDLATLVLEALAEAGDDDRLDVRIPDDVQPVLHNGGEMLRAAIAGLFHEVARRSIPDTPIEVSVEREAASPEHWRVVIAAESADERPVSFDPYRSTGSDSGVSESRSSLTLAVARGIVELLNGRLSVRYSRRRIECTVLLPATSTSA